MLLRRRTLHRYKSNVILANANINSALQSTAQELARQRATDSLKKGLERRPEKEELVERTCFSY